ncbi:DUF6893 family small protein [Streptomyces sp. NBC_01537]
MTMRTMRKILLGAAAAAAGYVLVSNLPDVRRYLRISTM